MLDRVASPDATTSEVTRILSAATRSVMKRNTARSTVPSSERPNASSRVEKALNNRANDFGNASTVRVKAARDST